MLPPPLAATGIVGCPFPCIQYGITDKAIGHNCILGCCYAAHCTHCAAYTQRRHLKKGDLITDCLLAWCCPHCVIMQCANEVGESATFSHWTLKDLLKPPTAQDINKEIKDAVADGTSGL